MKIHSSLRRSCRLSADGDARRDAGRRGQPQSADGKQLSAADADQQPRRPNKHQLSITGRPMSNVKSTR